MTENHDAVIHDAEAGGESRCPVPHGRAPYPTEAGANRGWWPNQLNLKILAQNPAVANPKRSPTSCATFSATSDRRRRLASRIMIRRRPEILIDSRK